MKTHAFLISTFIILGFAVGFLVDVPTIELSKEQAPSFDHFLSPSERNSLVGKNINDVIRMFYAPGGITITGAPDGGDSYIEFFVNNDLQRKRSRYLSVHFDGTTVKRTEVVTKAGLTTPQRLFLQAGSIVLQ